MRYAFTAEGQARYPSKSYIRRLLEMLVDKLWHGLCFAFPLLMLLLLGILAAATFLGFRNGGGDNLGGAPLPHAREIDYHQLLKYPLIQICRKRGLSVQGTRQDLIHRLQQYDAGKKI